ncbi:MAG TPA: zinc metalloprotease HtpX [Fimbriimonadaceae bacterium]|nr:zinc metalloprotease HtpX [Fimbriimonadaceae bacterium]
MNTLKVGFLLVALTALFIFIGNLIGGQTGVVIAFALALIMNFGSYWYSDKLVLSMTRARPVSPAEAPELHQMVDRLAAKADIPKPKVYVVDDPSPNAFATGRNPAHGAVAVNTGLLNILDRPEVEGVVAHEIAHIKHRDTLTMTVVATIAGAIMMLAQFAQFAAIFGGGHSDEEGRGGNPLVLLLVALVAPIAAMIVQMAISRAREYEADRLGAELAGTPRGLANALLKLDKGAAMIPTHSQQPQTAHLCIVNPLRGAAFSSLFSTHPPVEERVRRLMALERLAA